MKTRYLSDLDGNLLRSDERVSEYSADIINSIYQKDIYSGAQWCEILPKDATKANADLQLKAMLDCDKIVVFGDNRNDLSMFLVADERYAVANAVQELKDIATGVIDANDYDGVARWLKNMLTSNEK